MQTRPWIVRISVSLLPIVLLICIVLFGWFFTFNKPDIIKQALSHNSVYAAVNPTEILQQQLPATTAGSEIVDSELQQIIGASISPTFLQTSIERYIDKTYTWMQGRGPQPETLIETTDIKDQLAAKVQQKTIEQLQALPACKPGSQLPTSLDAALTLQCRPLGLSAEMLANLASNFTTNGEIADQAAAQVSEVFEQSSIQSTNIQAFQRVAELHTAYTVVLYGLPIIAIILALSIVFYSHTKRKGLRILAIIVLVCGIVGLGMSQLGGLFVQQGVKLVLPDIGLSSELSNALGGAIREVLHTLQFKILIIVGAYVVFGLLILTGLICIRPHRSIPVNATHKNKPQGAL